MVVFFAPSIRALAYGTCNNSSSGIHYSSPLCQHIHQKLQTLPYIQLHIHHGRKTPFRYQKTTKYLQTGGEVSEAGNCSIHCGVYETKGERCMDCSLGLSEWKQEVRFQLTICSLCGELKVVKPRLKPMPQGLGCQRARPRLFLNKLLSVAIMASL